MIEWGEAQSLRAADLYFAGRYEEALELETRLLQVRLEHLGPRHSETARSFYSIGRILVAEGRYQEAEERFLAALDVLRPAEGPARINEAHVLSGLAVLYLELRDHERARPLLEESLKIRLELLGERDPSTVEGLNGLAGAYREAGDMVRAEQLLSRALDALEGVEGNHALEHATILNNLGELHHAMGDFPRAERSFEESLALRRKMLRGSHPDVAISLNNLALLSKDLALASHDVGLAARARSLFAESLEMWLGLHGQEHPRTWVAMDNFATFECFQRNFGAAEPLLQGVLELRRRALGPDHPDVAAALNNLALCRFLQGDLAGATQLAGQSLDLRRRALGERHPETAIGWMNLGSGFAFGGDDRRAEPHLRRGLRLLRGHLDSAAAAQSERQQLQAVAHLQQNLHSWLAVAARAGISGAEQYSEVLAWKGAVTAAQELSRRKRTTPQSVRAYRELRWVNGRLSALAGRFPEPSGQADWRRQLEALTDRRERLERELASMGVGAGTELRRRGAAAGTVELQRALPPGTALVDLLVYQHFEPPRENGWIPAHGTDLEARLIGFVVRSDRPVVRVELGPVERIEVALDAWRRSFSAEDGERLGPDRRAGRRRRAGPQTPTRAAEQGLGGRRIAPSPR